MNFFVSEEALGGAGRSRREMRAEIAALCDKLDAEREKRDELLAALRRTMPRQRRCARCLRISATR